MKPVAIWLISALGFGGLAVAMFVTGNTLLGAAFAFLAVSMLAGAVGKNAQKGKEPLG